MHSKKGNAKAKTGNTWKTLSISNVPRSSNIARLKFLLFGLKVVGLKYKAKRLPLKIAKINSLFPIGFLKNDIFKKSPLI